MYQCILKTGGQWDGDVYVDGMLPFGLRLAPLLFTAFRDALESTWGRMAAPLYR